MKFVPISWLKMMKHHHAALKRHVATVAISVFVLQEITIEMIAQKMSLSKNILSLWWLSHKDQFEILPSILRPMRRPLNSDGDNKMVYLNSNKACSTLQSRMSLCYIRSRLLSMYHLDELKCDRQNQMVNIMITAPNQKACVYAKHTLAGVNRRIWTDNQFEDCHNAEMLGMIYKSSRHFL